MKYLFIAFHLLLFSCVVGNITPELKFYHVSHEQGLSQSTVNAVLKDSQGYYWFCTNDGVNKWNGYDFKYYAHDFEDPSSIGMGRVNTIHEDDNGVVWIGTNEGGISKYNAELDNFTNYLISEDENSRHNLNNVISIIQFGENLLVGTYYKGLLLFDTHSKKFIPINITNKLGEAYTNLIALILFYDMDSNLWVGSHSGILKAHIGVNELLDAKSISAEKYLKDTEEVLSIYQTANNTIWVGTYGDGAYVFDKDMNKRHLSHGVLNHSIVRGFTEDEEGKVWIGTGGGGVNIYDPSTEKIEYYFPHLANKYSISSNIIYCLYTDEDKNIWIGTYNGGVSHTNRYKQSFNHIRSFGSYGDINNNSILSFFQFDEKYIWIGTDGGGINVYNTETNIHTPLKLQGYTMPKVVTCFSEDKRGNIYIGTFREGLFIYNRQTRKVKHYTENTKASLPSNDVWSIAISENNEDVWLASLGGGLVKYLPEEEEFVILRHERDNPESISDDYVSSLFYDSMGNLWIGTLQGGVNVMPHNAEGVFRKMVNKESGVVGSEVRAVFEDSQGRVFIGKQDGGVFMYNPATEVYRNFSEKNGLPSNTVVGLLEDDAQNIWMSTLKGISKVKISGDSIEFIQNYSSIDGLQGNEFNSNAALRSQCGVFYFGGLNGYNAFNPNSISDNTKAGRLILTGFQVFDKEMLPGHEGSPLTKELNHTKRIKLLYNQSTITFKYAMLDYTVPELNTYEYRLKGIDEGWTNAQNLRRATYTNLDPGTYFFEVRAKNSQGISALNTLSLEIYIKPPFFKTILFRFIVLAGIVFLLLSIYRFRVRTLRINSDLLRTLVDERTKELKSVNIALEQRSKEVFEQSDVLMEQQHEILKSHKQLEESYKKIEQQNIELANHRVNLEETVKERTAELEIAKLKAEESEQLKMAFLSNMSHEIRTPMNAIVGFASLLSDSQLTEEEKNEYVRQVNKNSDSLLLLIDDILDLSKIEANQLLISPTTFELNSFVDELHFNWLHIQQNNNSAVNLVLQNNIATKKIYVESDELRLRQILNNLLDNAFKFTSLGKVTLTVSEEGGKVTFAVNDTGIGISQNNIDEIFDRFRKGEVVGRKLYRGAGLGLAISKKLANLIGGDLRAESEVNKGSTFYLTITAERSEETEEPLQNKKLEKTPEVNLKGLKVLVAEDEEANYFYLEGVLSRQGVEIDWAKNGEEAIKAVSVNQYDLVFMDIKMPVIDGIAATRRIKEMFPNQLIVAQTAFARPEEETEFMKVGFDDYIAKPIKKNELICLVERLRASM